MLAARDEAGGGTGSARRRRERRLRVYLRYARMSVAMALAESQHRSAQRQRKVRAREEDREVQCTAAFRATDPPPEPELFDFFEEPGGVRPVLLIEPQGAHARVERHTGVGYELVQALDVPVLHMMEVADEVNDRATLQLFRDLANLPGAPLGIQQRTPEHASSFGVQLVPQERAQQRVPEQVSSSGIQLVPQERVQQGSVESVSSSWDQLVPQEREQQRSVEQVADVPAPLRWELLRRSEQGGGVHGMVVVSLQGWLQADSNVPAVPAREVPVRLGVHVRSSCERTAPTGA